MTKRVLIRVLLVASLALLTGCVYYNTFYHARAASREAEIMRERRPPGTPAGAVERELLERVAEKCGRVLQLHPDSEWADDALLLLGTTHYHQERYETAERRLTEFLSMHPDSELRPEAEYMLASVLLSRGNAVSAETTLEALVEVEPPHALSDDALALIGKARNTRGRYDEAAQAYLRALERFPRSDRRAEIRFLAAENYEEAGDLDAAAREFALVPTEKGSRTFAFEARMRLAEVDLQRDHPEEAQAVLEELERRVDSRDERDRVLLLKGLALEAAGDVESAIETYEGISASHKRSEASGEAHYRIGLIHRDRYELLDEAAESFKTARDEAPRTDVSRKATEAMEDVTKLIGFLATIEDGAAVEEGVAGDEETGEGEPEVDTPPEGVVADTARGLTVLPTDLMTDAADSLMAAVVGSDSAVVAVVETDSAAVAADSAAIVPAEADSIAAAIVEVDSTTAVPAEVDTTVMAHVLDDTTALATAFDDTTALAAALADTIDEVAVARFRAAELYLFRFDDPERAVVHYTAVLEEHPESDLAPKAGLALGWTLESRLGDETRALEVYETVIDGYPDTDFAVAATEAVARMAGTDDPLP